jgi:hypothetical protein
MNDKGKLLSERDVEDLAMKIYREKIKAVQEKEKFISEMPYSDEYPRLAGSKYLSCHSVILRSFYLSIALSLLYGFAYTNLRYSKIFIL